eukprot:scaffold153998_cov28-Tisochrysis_lutea.AAC.6
MRRHSLCRSPVGWRSACRVKVERTVDAATPVQQLPACARRTSCHAHPHSRGRGGEGSCGHSTECDAHRPS